MAPIIYRSPLPDVPIPHTSVFSFLFQGSNYSKHPESTKAFVDAVSGRSLTRGEVKDLALRIAYGLKNVLGKKRGDTVMIFSPNHLIYPSLIFSCPAAGVKSTFANAAYTAKELLYQYKTSGASTIFVPPALVPVAVEMLTLAGVTDIKKTLVVMGFEDDEGVKELGKTWVTLPQVYGAGKLHEQEVEKFDGAESSETAYMCFSSGTTGLPKGVETMHRNVTAVLNICSLQMADFFPEGQHKTLLGILPFSHIMGLVVTLHLVFFKGCTLVFQPRFEPLLFFEAIQKYKCTSAFIAPPILVILNIHPALPKYDLSSIEILGSGAAPLPASLAYSVRDRFKKLYGTDIIVGNGYGMTETSPGSQTMPMKWAWAKIGSVGTLFPNTLARLVCDDGVDAEVGGSGELWVKGPQIMKGYINNEAATKDIITPDGWLKTGDYGSVDKDGFWWISGRKKELIKYNVPSQLVPVFGSCLTIAISTLQGFQVSPPELESVLLENLTVADVGVIGVYEESMATELPRAYVVPRAGMDSIKDPKAREAFCKGVEKFVEERVAKHKYLRGGVVPIEAIPKNPSGKILRRELVLIAEREKQTKSRL